MTIRAGIEAANKNSSIYPWWETRVTAKIAYAVYNNFYSLRKGAWAAVNLLLISINYAAMSYCC